MGWACRMKIDHTWYNQGCYVFFTDPFIQKQAYAYLGQLEQHQRLWWDIRQYDDDSRLVEWVIE